MGNQSQIIEQESFLNHRHPMLKNAVSICKGEQTFIRVEMKLERSKDFRIWETALEQEPCLSCKQAFFPRYKSLKQQQTMCSDTFFAKGIYPSAWDVLEDQINDFKESNLPIPEIDLFRILSSLCETAHHYHKQGMKVGDIRPLNILMNLEKGFIKVITQHSFPGGLTNYQIARRESMTYLSPKEYENLLYLRQKDPVQIHENEAFSVGLTLLDAAILSKSYNLYKNDYFDQNGLKKKQDKLIQSDFYTPIMKGIILGLTHTQNRYRLKLKCIRQWASHIASSLEPFVIVTQNIPEHLLNYILTCRRMEFYLKPCLFYQIRNQKLLHSKNQKQGEINCQERKFMKKNYPEIVEPKKSHRLSNHSQFSFEQRQIQRQSSSKQPSNLEKSERFQKSQLGYTPFTPNAEQQKSPELINVQEHQSSSRRSEKLSQKPLSKNSNSNVEQREISREVSSKQHSNLQKSQRSQKPSKVQSKYIPYTPHVEQQKPSEIINIPKQSSKRSEQLSQKSSSKHSQSNAGQRQVSSKVSSKQPSNVEKSKRFQKPSKVQNPSQSASISENQPSRRFSQPQSQEPSSKYSHLNTEQIHLLSQNSSKKPSNDYRFQQLSKVPKYNNPYVEKEEQTPLKLEKSPKMEYQKLLGSNLSRDDKLPIESKQVSFISKEKKRMINQYENSSQMKKRQNIIIKQYDQSQVSSKGSNQSEKTKYYKEKNEKI